MNDICESQFTKTNEHPCKSSQLGSSKDEPMGTTLEHYIIESSSVAAVGGKGGSR